MNSVVYGIDGRVIGTIQDGKFYKRVNPRIHQLFRPRGWATDADSFDEEVAPHCHSIVLIDIITGNRITTSVDVFIEHRLTINRGFGRQYVLPLKWWNALDRHQGNLFR